MEDSITMDSVKVEKLQRTVAALPHLDEEACLDILQGVNWKVELAISLFVGKNQSTTPPLSDSDWPVLAVHNEHSAKQRNSGQLNLSTERGSSALPDMLEKCASLRIASPKQPIPSTQLVSEIQDTQGLSFKRALQGVNSTFLYSILQAELNFEANRELLFAVHGDATKVIILMRGVPGSGKSTLAKVFVALTEHGVCHSADDYFINARGVYNFHPEKLKAAHSMAQSNCKHSLRKGVTPVVIDNTNTQAWEMIPYMELAMEFGYEVRLVEPNTPWKERVEILAKKTIHGVPRKKIDEMMRRFEKNVEPDMLMRLTKAKMLNDKGKQATSAPTSPITGATEYRKQLSRENILQDLNSEHSTEFQYSCSTTVPTVELSSLALRDIVLSTSARTTFRPSATVLMREESETLPRISNNSTPSSSATLYLEGEKRLEVNYTSQWSENELPTWTDSPSPNVSPEVDIEPLLQQNLPILDASDSKSETDNIGVQQELNRRANILHNLFPNIQTSYLDDLFQKSNGDLGWCVDILVSGEYVMNGDHHGERVTALKFGNSGEIISSDDDIGKLKVKSKRSESSQGLNERTEVSSPNADDFPRATCSQNYSSAELRRASTHLSSDYVTEGGYDTFSHPPERVKSSQDVLLKPIDGVDWLDLELNQAFITELDKLYPHPFEENLIVPQHIRIPPTLAFELYKLILANEAYRKTLASTEVDKGEGETSQLNRSRGPNTLAVIMRIGKLKSAFPGVEEETIRNVYASTEENYDETLDILKKRFGRSFNSKGLVGDFSNTQLCRLGNRRNSFSEYGKSNGESLSYFKAKSKVADDVTDFMAAQGWRDRAYEHHLKRSEYKAKLNEINRQAVGAGGQAEYLRGEILKHTRKMEEAKRRAKDNISSAGITVDDDTVLDLHFFYVREAISVLQKYLQEWNQRLTRSGGGRIVLRIITGKGNNSGGSGPRIRPSVVQFLTSNHYDHSVFEGVVFLTLDVKRKEK